MNKTTHPFFISNGEDRKETATLLVGTADEYDIDQRDIRMVRGGFRISEALADALGLDTSDEDETEDWDNQDAPEPEGGHPDVLTGQVAVSGNEPETIGDEVPDPDSEGERTGDEAAADPENPVEAEAPVEVAPDEDAPAKERSSTSKRSRAKKAPANQTD